MISSFEEILNKVKFSNRKKLKILLRNIHKFAKVPMLKLTMVPWLVYSFGQVYIVYTDIMNLKEWRIRGLEE